MRMAHCCGLSGPKTGCGCWEQRAEPLVTKLSIVAMTWVRSGSKSHWVGSTAKSPGDEAGLRRKSPRARKSSDVITRSIAVADPPRLVRGDVDLSHRHDGVHRVFG